MKFELECCGKKNPLGVDKQNIRLSFALDGSLDAVSYRVTVWEKASGRQVYCLDGTPEDGFTVWVEGDCLQGQTAYGWQAAVCLSDGKTVLSEQAQFETGLEQWCGQWITGPCEPGQVLAFCRELAITRLPQKARLYICGLGYFTAKLNGKPVDDAYFIPPVTDYSVRQELLREGTHISTGHRVNYYTYDVTGLLTDGLNTLYAEVADGYYSNWEKAHYEPQPDMSFGKPCLIYELHLEDENGNIQKIVSGTDTKARGVRGSARLYSGDRADLSQSPVEYGPACLCAAPTGVMTAPLCPPDKLQRVLMPVASWKTPEGTVYDFGVNHSGGLAFTARAEKITELKIRFAEVLRADGTLNYETGAWHATHIHTGRPKSIYQENTYRLKKGTHLIAPKFSWFCYRYALIPDTVEISELCSFFIHMDVKQSGSFACADPVLERINEMFLQTLRCNMHSGVLSDCPHRERLPYTGDGGLIMKSVCYGLDGLSFYYKWFRDLLDAQCENGLIPNTAPHLGGGGGYAWGNAICTVTKQLYTLTGDRKIAREGYGAVKKWLGYYESKRDADYIIRSNSHCWLLGDWLAPEVVSSNVYYISTVCYLQAVKTACFLARIIAPADCPEWEALEKHIKSGIHRVFFDEKKLSYGHGVQGENVLALAEGIVPEQYEKRMRDALYQHYAVETDYHLDTGIVLTPVLLDYLTDCGFREIALKIMTAKTYPSYYSLMENDTTFSEHWGKKWPDYYVGEIGRSELVKGGGDLSHCHPMYGSVVCWLYERVAGLDLSELYQRTVWIKPYFMDCLPWAKAEKKTAFGKVSVSWKQENGRYSLCVSVPKGLTAKCYFPAQCHHLQDSAANQVYHPSEKGYFCFSLSAGQWHLTN